MLKYRPILWLMILANIALALSTTKAIAESGTNIGIDLDLSRPGVLASNVMMRSLYFADPSKPTDGFGPQAVGSFKSGSVLFPFQVSKSDSYSLVVSYYHTAYRKLIDIKVDGQTPPGWTNVELWPSSPDYRWGSPQLDHGAPPPIAWKLPGKVSLAAGSHTIQFNFQSGGVLIKSTYFTTQSPPANPSKPWAIVGNSIFPALDFFNHLVTTLPDGRLRITFNGLLTNLAPGDVTFTVKTSTLLRDNSTTQLFGVTLVNTGSTLQLMKAQSVPFSLTVESAAPVPDNYSEIIRLDLTSLDVPNLSKPYLMDAAQSYLPIQTTTPLNYVMGYNDAGLAPVDGTDLSHLIPSRQTLGFANGIYERPDVDEAFVHGLATAPTHIVTKSGLDLTEWALTRPTTILEHPTENNRAPFIDSPLAGINASLGQGASEALLREAILYYSNEMPYYPVMRWDVARPFILPALHYEFGGVSLLTSYVKLLQKRGVSDDEHFRFLHNVILPLFLSYRDDLRITGTLAQPYSPGQSAASFQVANAPNMDIANRVGDWIKLGTGSKTEFIHLDVGALGQNQYIFYHPAQGLGNAQLVHNAGEPFTSYHMREWTELEGTDIWTFLATAAASKDSAVQEQCADWINTLYSTQKVFRADGSFGNEPGSYGFSAFVYIDLANQIFAFLGKSTLPAYDSLKNLMLNSLIMWNDFPFSDGSYPQLNNGGAVNQLTRLDRSLKLLKTMFPERTDLISFYQKIIDEENARSAGTFVDNRSFKVDGWGYAMLRGTGPWDTRMETLLSSKHLGYDPGAHVSTDTLGIVAFANGTILTPRYGYDWRGYPYLLKNMVVIDRSEPAYWGSFVHFDPDPDMPSAVAMTDMATAWSATPGLAHQERWVVQLPEYLFDTFIVKPRDGKQHRFEWGYRNMGDLSIINPSVSLTDAKEPNGANWDPFANKQGQDGYIADTGHNGQQFTTSDLWQADWTMNEGSIMQPDSYAWPPHGSKMRLTMEGNPNTKITTAWLNGPARNQTTNLRQDFVVAERNDTQATYVDTIEPIAPENNGVVRDIQTTATNIPDNARSVKVTTTQGVDWFLVGTNDFNNARGSRTVGPFTSDAALAVIRIQNGAIVKAYCVGGTTMQFTEGTMTTSTQCTKELPSTQN